MKVRNRKGVLGTLVFKYVPRLEKSGYVVLDCRALLLLDDERVEPQGLRGNRTLVRLVLKREFQNIPVWFQRGLNRVPKA
jgi:hypothetical protein